MKRTTIALSLMIICAGCDEDRVHGARSLTTAVSTPLGTLPPEFSGTWKPVLDADYRAKMKESYVKHRRPGMPSYEKWSRGTRGLAQATWKFEPGELVATLGDQQQRVPFRILSQTDSRIVLKVKHERLGNLELELRQVEDQALELRVSTSTSSQAPPIRLVRARS
ncbi:MAG: hypothetical protein AB7K71_27745 [Polyangiaceae bacterium]